MKKYPPGKEIYTSIQLFRYPSETEKYTAESYQTQTQRVARHSLSGFLFWPSECVQFLNEPADSIPSERHELFSLLIDLQAVSSAPPQRSLVRDAFKPYTIAT